MSTPATLPRHFSRSDLMVENASGRSAAANVQARLDSPQPAQSSLNWIPAGQIPASPWDRPTKSQQPPSNDPGSQQPNTQTRELPGLQEGLRDRVIHQPISSVSAIHTLPANRHPKPSQMIGQPRVASTWQGLPEHGQTVEFDERQPIVDLGGPIPVDPTASGPIRGTHSTSTQVARPLEAYREQPSGSVEGTRRATRNPEPYRKEVGQVNSTDYLSSSPSTVVGVVAVPASSNRYVGEQEDRPMNTFVPSHDEIVSHVIPASVSEGNGFSSRARLASQVSRELLSDSQQTIGKAPMPLEPPAGWKKVEQELRDHLARCDELLRRNALLSARQEIMTGLRVLFRALDLRSGDWTSEPAFDQALAAFEEESDFHQSLRNPTHGRSTARIVAGHTTQALKQVDLSKVSPELASQHYRAYARQQLGKAAQGHPWAADLLYAFGKTYERRADLTDEEGLMYRNQAVACYNAALDVSSNHPDAANQLGYNLIRLDRIDEAEAILTQAIQTHPTSDAWKNLAELYRRQGRIDQAAFAVQEATALGKPPIETAIPEVYQVDPQTFAGLSPNQFMNLGVPNVGHKSDATVPPVAAPAKSASWFSRLVR